MATSDRGCADRDSMPCKTLVWSTQNKQGHRSCTSPLKQSDAQQEQRAGQGMGHWQVEGQGERQRKGKGKGKGKGKNRARQKAQQPGSNLGVSQTGSVAAMATTMRASRAHPSSAPASSTLPIQGSTGNPARVLPTTEVSLPAIAK